MDYKQYQKSRDASWTALIENHVSALPVKITEIVKNYGIPCVSYEKGKVILTAYGIVDRCFETDGFMMRAADRTVIFFDDTRSRQRCRFTIAHELGHYLCGHGVIQNGSVSYTAINREPSETDAPEEREANVCASRILAPACVLWALGITEASDIARLCDISITSASFRAERMRQLYSREKNYVRAKERSCFLLSDLEKQVYDQFRGYIKRVQKS